MQTNKSISGTESRKIVQRQGPKVSYSKRQDKAERSRAELRDEWHCDSEKLCNAAVICHGMNLTHTVTMTLIIHWE